MGMSRGPAYPQDTRGQQKQDRGPGGGDLSLSFPPSQHCDCLPTSFTTNLPSPLAAILEEGKREREREKRLGRGPVLRCARLKMGGVWCERGVPLFRRTMDLRARSLN